MTEDQMVYSVQLHNENLPESMINTPEGIPVSSVQLVQMELTQEQFDRLNIKGPITHYMYTEGKSEEEFPTNISARDVVKQMASCANIHDTIINGFHQREGLTKPTETVIYQNAIKIDEISPKAVKFMLDMHQLWMDPSEDPDVSEILEIADQYSLTLADFYRVS